MCMFIYKCLVAFPKEHGPRSIFESSDGGGGGFGDVRIANERCVQDRGQLRRIVKHPHILTIYFVIEGSPSSVVPAPAEGLNSKKNRKQNIKINICMNVVRYLHICYRGQVIKLNMNISKELDPSIAYIPSDMYAVFFILELESTLHERTNIFFSEFSKLFI